MVWNYIVILTAFRIPCWPNCSLPLPPLPSLRHKELRLSSTGQDKFVHSILFSNIKDFQFLGQRNYFTFLLDSRQMLINSVVIKFLLHILLCLEEIPTILWWIMQWYLLHINFATWFTTKYNRNYLVLVVLLNYSNYSWMINMYDYLTNVED